MSTAGGLAMAPARGRTIGAEAIQIFTRNQVQWKAKRVTRDEAAAFRSAVSGNGIRMVVAHASYLVNLASPDPAASRRSCAAFLSDLRRCEALGVAHLIFHPGAHLGAGERAGLTTLVASLDRILAATAGSKVIPLLEVTAGQGTCLGHRFEHLAEVLGGVRWPQRLGVCLDTCHLLAAGYDLATPRGYDETLAAFDRVVGFGHLKAFHLNDARHGLGSRLDRHAPVGRGHLGLAAFRRLVNDRRFRGLPAVLETPGGLEAWGRELALLRSLVRR